MLRLEAMAEDLKDGCGSSSTSGSMFCLRSFLEELRGE